MQAKVGQILDPTTNVVNIKIRFLSPRRRFFGGPFSEMQCNAHYLDVRESVLASTDRKRIILLLLETRYVFRFSKRA